MSFKMHTINIINLLPYFYRKEIILKKCLPILPKIFKPRNTLIFLFGLIILRAIIQSHPVLDSSCMLLIDDMVSPCQNF